MDVGAPAEEPQATAVQLATVVQHHPAREDLLPPLLERLGALKPQVIADPGHEQPHWNLWRAYSACLAACPDDATHLLVIQDDALPCRNFDKAAPLVLAARPDEIVCFYVGGGAIAQSMLRAARGCHSWALLPSHLWVPLVATAYPVGKVQELREWAAADSYARKSRQDDGVVGKYARTTHQRVWATVPSLVQHPDTVPSLVRRTFASGRDRHRVAACYIGDYDPMDIAW